jgi:hypothetical protein
MRGSAVGDVAQNGFAEYLGPTSSGCMLPGLGGIAFTEAPFPKPGWVISSGTIPGIFEIRD